MDEQRDGPTIGMLLEQTLGHVSHGRNLKRSLADDDRAEVRFRELPYEASRRVDQFPPLSNWTIRSGIAARAAVRDLQQEAALDALFVHTQVPATLLGRIMRRIPTMVSVDATPLQIDSLGTSYRHEVRSAPVESLKWRIQSTTFRSAAALVTWSQWAADSLVDDYRVDRGRIQVIPPGVVQSRWRRTEPRPDGGGVTRILFVGGDFDRKGGPLLLEAVRQLNDDDHARAGERGVELHLVTSAAVEAGPGVHVYRGLGPNDPELIELYHRCDVFALPTLGDCTPMVLAEAASAGLPSVATDVGAISETVIDGVTGLLVEPTVESLTASLRKVVNDVDYRRKLGFAAAKHAAETMDAEANAQRLLGRLIDLAVPEETASGRVLLTVSGDIAPTIHDEIESGERPLADYVAISEATGATLVDRTAVRADRSLPTSVVERVAGINAAMAFHLFRRRRELDVIVTDGEQIGLPLATMLRFGGRRGVRHVMIGHRLSPSKKTIPTRALRLHRGIDEVLVYSTSQLDAALMLFNHGATRVRHIDFMVDSDFFRPPETKPKASPESRPLLCTAGREFRDYPTLIEAVRDLEVDLIIASASPWSRRDDNANETDVPAHVKVTSLTQRELRDTLAGADIMIVPLQPTDFQAGVTSILEGMSMALPVICTSTVGQIDVVEDGVTGLYVPPADVAGMRRSIEHLLANPQEARHMGARGREFVVASADVRTYAETFAAIVRWHAALVHADPTRRGDRA